MNRAKLVRLTQALMERLQAVGTDPPWGEIHLVLIGDRYSERVNRQALGHAGATDVITLRLAPIPGEASQVWSAELFVNVDRAWSVGRNPGAGSPSRELALYIAHGFDHLSGWDDRTPEGARRMRRREWRWLKPLDTEGFFGGSRTCHARKKTVKFQS